ncbi:MAG TPA: trehalose-6-phosphate synthase [Candidatus Nanopelagicales bacterium]
MDDAVSLHTVPDIRVELANETVSGYDFLVVCNRLPVEMRPDGDGKVTWTRSPGGLVAAMEPALSGREAIWIGWSGHHIDDTLPVSPVPPEVGPCDLQEVALSREDVEEYYEGFCNATIWPLYHDAVVTPSYHRRAWDRYVAVNRRFATATARLAAPGATVWVHDYQLQLVPRMLRELRPDLVIGFFLHIPFPPSELFAQLPWRRQVVEGLLGADLVGFQTEGGAANFLALTSRLLGLSPDSDGVDVVSADGGTRRVKVGAFPISIDTAEYDALARRPDVRARAAAIREAVGSPTHLLLGVDRLDYTKGIDVRLKAITELLEDGLVDDCVFIQVATPSRENVEDYQNMRDEIDQMVGRAIGDHGSIGSPPIQYLHQPLPREELVAYYVASDVMLVTPYRDGMNLVAKEYVACRTEGDGVLVLSEFTGAAIDLPHSFLVNPYDADGVKDAIIAAISVPDEDLRTRMTAMRDQVFAHDVDRWAREFLSALHDER